jgi:hypothetical protein
MYARWTESHLVQTIVFISFKYPLVRVRKNYFDFVLWTAISENKCKYIYSIMVICELNEETICALCHELERKRYVKIKI